MGIDYTKLTYRFQGRDFRLIDTSGNVVKKILLKVAWASCSCVPTGCAKAERGVPIPCHEL